MKIKLFTLIMTFFGCTHSLSQESPSEIKTVSAGGRYKAPTFMTWEAWLEKILNERAHKGSLDIISLTSSGGFHGGGSGNIFVLVNKKHGNGSLIATAPMHAPKKGSKVSYDTHELSSDTIATFLKERDSFPSQTYTSSGFDLYRYTWTQYSFNDNKLLRTSKPVSFDDPFIGSSGSLRHQGIINAFKNLKKPNKIK